MIGTRLTLALMLAAGVVSPGLGFDGGLFHRKARLDPARRAELIDIVRSDPDAKKRAAAAIRARRS